MAQGLIAPDEPITATQAANLIFRPGFTTASEVTGLSGRGIGMDVVRAELNALGGRIETQTEAGKGSSFRMLLPLTTAVTQVVMLRAGGLTLGVPANLVEVVRRSPVAQVDAAYASQWFAEGSGVAAVLLGRRLDAIGTAQHRSGGQDPAGDHSAQRLAAPGPACGRGAGQSGSGGEEPGAAAVAPAGVAGMSVLASGRWC